MATIAAVPSAHADALPRQQNLFWQFVKSQPLGIVGFLVILLYVVCAFGAAWISPYDPEAIDFGAMLTRPRRRALVRHRPVRPRRLLAASSTARARRWRSASSRPWSAAPLGALVGAVSGYFGGRIDNWIQRVVDIMLSFPIIVLAMVVVAVLGKRTVGGIDTNLIVAIALPIVPKMARVARASTLSIVAMPFIDAARAAGFSHSRIVLRHILPNIVAPYLILVTAFIAQAILLEASLSFLGLGVTEPTPAWGLMLSGASADFYQTAPWMILFPGLAITLAVFAFNLFGDSLRDWLDPKLKS